MVLANPEIAQLPSWVIALVAAGGLAAALSTAAGLLLVISTSISRDLIKKQLRPDISEKGELLAARISILVAVVIAGLFGIYPPGFVAAVVALAFGLGFDLALAFVFALGLDPALFFAAARLAGAFFAFGSFSTASSRDCIERSIHSAKKRISGIRSRVEMMLKLMRPL